MIGYHPEYAFPRILDKVTHPAEHLLVRGLID